MLDNLSCKVLYNESLAPYTSWKVGGECSAIVFPESIDDIKNILNYCKKKETPYFVMGNGSNILKSDKFFDGIVINVAKTLNTITIQENKIVVGSGCMLPKLAFHMAKSGIGGFSFFAGIPGTVGGAIVMNAGSAGKETKDILLSVSYIDELGVLRKEYAEDIEFGFRRSRFQSRNIVILSAEFLKEEEDSKLAMTSTKLIAERRRRKFPLNVPTAGSTFKSPIGGPYPGQLIEITGLKGFTIGGAKVSDLHANWIVNNGNATANDIQNLIEFIADKVYESQGVRLEVEVIYKD